MATYFIYFWSFHYSTWLPSNWIRHMSYENSSKEPLFLLFFTQSTLIKNVTTSLTHFMLNAIGQNLVRLCLLWPYLPRHLHKLFPCGAFVFTLHSGCYILTCLAHCILGEYFAMIGKYLRFDGQVHNKPFVLHAYPVKRQLKYIRQNIIQFCPSLFA